MGQCSMKSLHQCHIHWINSSHNKTYEWRGEPLSLVEVNSFYSDIWLCLRACGVDMAIIHRVIPHDRDKYANKSFF